MFSLPSPQPSCIHRFIFNELSLPLLSNNCFLFSLRFYRLELLFFLSSNFRWCHFFDSQTRLSCRLRFHLPSPDADFNFCLSVVELHQQRLLFTKAMKKKSILSLRHQLEWLSATFILGMTQKTTIEIIPNKIKSEFVRKIAKSCRNSLDSIFS